MKLIMMILFNVLWVYALSGFSINPGVFEIDCNAGNKINLEYELRCTKDVPEFIKVEYANLSGTILTNQIQLPRQEIKLEPNAVPYKLNILIRTPLESDPENILKISFYDVPQSKSPISISSRISTRAYIRYKEKIKTDYEFENLELKKSLNRGQIVYSLVVTLKNKGNTYIKPKGTLVFKNLKKEVFQFDLNPFDEPVYTGQSRGLETMISASPKPDVYDVEMRTKTVPVEDKLFQFKIEITKENKIILLDKKK